MTRPIIAALLCLAACGPDQAPSVDARTAQELVNAATITMRALQPVTESLGRYDVARPNGNLYVLADTKAEGVFLRAQFTHITEKQETEWAPVDVADGSTPAGSGLHVFPSQLGGIQLTVRAAVPIRFVGEVAACMVVDGRDVCGPSICFRSCVGD